MKSNEIKVGFVSLDEMKGFLSGLHDTETSKVYVRIETRNGRYYLCVYVENNYDEDVLPEFREHFNGTYKRSELEMNAAEWATNEQLTETIQNITVQAWPEIYGEDNEHDEDSLALLSKFRLWGMEFERWWNSLGEDGQEQLDYIEEIEKFTERRVKEYLNKYE